MKYIKTAVAVAISAATAIRRGVTTAKSASVWSAPEGCNNDEY